MSEIPSVPDDLIKDGFLSHLAELRSCLLRAVCSILVAFIMLVPFSGELYSFLAAPLLKKLPNGSDLVAIGILSPFIVPMVISFFTAFLITLPYVLYQLWRFVAPGLYQQEKNLILPLVFSSTLLFFIGMAFAYLLVFQTVFGFIASISPDSVKWTPDIGEYFSFVMTIFIAFGVAFEIPVVVYMLVRANVVEVATLKKARPYVIVGAFVIAAIFTPPDVISQLMLAIPCWLLFELGLLLAPKTKQKKDETPE